jgi:hypothetical protein
MTDEVQAIAYEAVVELAVGADERAPGGAVTQALCGHLVTGDDERAWEHSGPCRWPHRTAVDGRTGATLTVRVVAVSPATERAGVSRLIEGALRAGELTGPAGLSQWALVRAEPVDPRADERDLAQRLATPRG